MTQKITVKQGSTLTLLGVLFVALKLTGHIDWSWWYVTLPFWLMPAVIFGLVVFTLLCAIIGAVLGN